VETKEIVSNMPRFEIRHFYDDDWNKISEKDFLLELVDNLELITPVLSDLFQGKEIIANFCIYRIKL